MPASGTSLGAPAKRQRRKAVVTDSELKRAIRAAIAEGLTVHAIDAATGLVVTTPIEQPAPVDDPGGWGDDEGALSGPVD